MFLIKKKIKYMTYEEFLEMQNKFYHTYMFRFNFFLFNDYVTISKSKEELSYLDKYCNNSKFMNGLDEYLKNHKEELGDLLRIIVEGNKQKIEFIKKYLPESTWKYLMVLKDDFDFFD